MFSVGVLHKMCELLGVIYVLMSKGHLTRPSVYLSVTLFLRV